METEGGAGSGAGGLDPLLMMEEVVDMLKLLNYESLFCRQKGFKPFSRSYFAVPSSNSSEQFMQFVQLVSWLLELNNQKVSGWNKYDDPTTASQNMVLELKKMGIPILIHNKVPKY